MANLTNYRSSIKQKLDSADQGDVGEISRYTELLNQVNSSLHETVEERYVEFPAIGDGTAASNGNQKLRPAEPSTSVSFFSGANSLPADCDYVKLSVFLTREYLSQNSSDVKDSVNYSAYATLDGNPPNISQDRGFVFKHGYTYTYSRSQAENLRVIANADPNAAVNERAFAVCQFNIGSLPENLIYPSSPLFISE